VTVVSGSEPADSLGRNRSSIVRRHTIAYCRSIRGTSHSFHHWSSELASSCPIELRVQRMAGLAPCLLATTAHSLATATTISSM
jgi:hypothetical protein